MMMCEDNAMGRGRKSMLMMTSDGLSSRTGGGDGEWWMVIVDVDQTGSSAIKTRVPTNNTVIHS